MTPTWWLISDIDGTLTGDAAALVSLREFLERESGRVGFGVATGRSPALTGEAVLEFGLPQPQLRICSVGSQILGGGITGGTAAGQWPGPQAATWSRDRIMDLLDSVPDLELQPPAGQGPYKVSYLATAEAAEVAAEVLFNAGVPANAIHSAGSYLDILPAGVSKGAAVRFVADRLDLPLEQVIVAGDTGNDLDLLTCGARAILVSNHTPELDHLRNHPLVHAASQPHAAGVIEGLINYGVWSGQRE